MQIKVRIINVGEVKTMPSGGGRSYKQIDVLHEDLNGGEAKTRSLRSFANPGVFKQFSTGEFKAGDIVEVDAEKDEMGYWQWRSVKKTEVEVVENTPEVKTKPVGKVTGSNYETPEERAIRRAFEVYKQTVISRQACINSAIAWYELSKGKPNLAELIDTAEYLEQWVTRTGTPPAGEQVDDDPPFDTE